jgi:hypothetical protein
MGCDSGGSNACTCALPQGRGSFLPIFRCAWRAIVLRHYRAGLWKGKGVMQPVLADYLCRITIPSRWIHAYALVLSRSVFVPLLRRSITDFGVAWQSWIACKLFNYRICVFLTR